MEKRVSFLVLAVLVVAALSCVLPSALASPTGGKQAAPGYICTHCKIGSETAGKCPLCKEEMKPAGKFVCPTCDTTSDKPGKCPCGKDYVKIEMAGVKCPGCGYYISKEAHGCPVCKAAQAKTKTS